MSAPATKKRKVETGGFPKSLKTGTGLAVQKDLSHKVSAKQTDTMFQNVLENPQSFKPMIPKLKLATNAPPRQDKKFKQDTDYLQNHAPYPQAPMSPKSQRAAYNVFNTFANKNADNLRPRKDRENRSIGEFPHYNIDKGQLSPRSRRAQQVVETFEAQYAPHLSTKDQDLTATYTSAMDQRLKTAGKSFSTADQVKFASDARKGNL